MLPPTFLFIVPKIHIHSYLSHPAFFSQLRPLKIVAEVFPLHLFLPFLCLFEWIFCVSHLCLRRLFCLIFTVFSYSCSLKAHKLISLNWSCFCEKHCCQQAQEGRLLPFTPWQARKRVISQLGGDQFAQLHQAMVPHAAMETMDKNQELDIFYSAGCLRFAPSLSTRLVANAALLALELFEGNICYALLTSLLKISTKPQSSFDIPIHAHTA